MMSKVKKILFVEDDEKDLVNSYNLDAKAFVVKPVEFERFVDAVKQLGLFWAVLNESPKAGG